MKTPAPRRAMTQRTPQCGLPAGRSEPGLASSSAEQREQGSAQSLPPSRRLASAPGGRTHPRYLECRGDRAIELVQQRSELAGQAFVCQNRLGGAERLK